MAEDNLYEVRPLCGDSWHGRSGPLRRISESFQEEVRGRVKTVADRLECGHLVYHCGAAPAQRRHCSACADPPLQWRFIPKSE
jgi:hypothetical protein